MSCEMKSCMFIRNKSIIKVFLTSNTNTSYIHNIAFSSEKVASSESGEKYAQIKHHWKQSKRFLNKYTALQKFGNTLGKVCFGRYQHKSLYLFVQYIKVTWHYHWRPAIKHNNGNIYMSKSDMPLCQLWCLVTGLNLTQVFKRFLGQHTLIL